MSNLQDEHKFCSIVDRSGWPIVCVINMKSRFDFISQILMEEWFDKQLSALKNFREGLDHFGLLCLMERNPDTWKPLFMKDDASSSKHITAGKFLSLVLSEPKTDMEKRAYSQFVHFVNKVDNLSGTVYTAL